jgi:hypothetical protein
VFGVASATQGSIASADGAERGRFLAVFQPALKLAVAWPSANALPGDASGGYNFEQTGALPGSVALKSVGEIIG